MVRTVSISMTVLKAFSDSPERGARKFPAAPTGKSRTSGRGQIPASPDGATGRPRLTANDEIDSTKLLNGLPHRLPDLIRLSHVRPGSHTSLPRSLGQLLGGFSDPLQAAHIRLTGQPRRVK